MRGKTVADLRNNAARQEKLSQNHGVLALGGTGIPAGGGTGIPAGGGTGISAGGGTGISAGGGTGIPAGGGTGIPAGGGTGIPAGGPCHTPSGTGRMPVPPLPLSSENTRGENIERTRNQQDHALLA